jgi:hypothetical protein
LELVTKHPLKVIRIKVANLWNFWLRAENWQKTRLLILMQSFYLFWVLLGLALLLRNGQISRVKYGLIMIGALWAEHCLVFAWGRFSLDLVPVLGLICGLGIASFTAQAQAAGNFTSASRRANAV